MGRESELRLEKTLGTFSCHILTYTFAGLTFELTRPRKQAHPAVAGRVQRGVRPRRR